MVCICKKDLIKFLKIYQLQARIAEDCVVVYENRADNPSNILRLSEISILISFQFYSKIKRNQL